MANTFTTDLLRTAITGRFAYVNFNEDNTTAIRHGQGVPCPVTSVRWIAKAARFRAGSGNELTFAIDFRWRKRDQPYPDYVISTLIEFTPTGDFRILKADGHGDLSDWRRPWQQRKGFLFIDELASMCICDFLEAHSAQVLDEA